MLTMSRGTVLKKMKAPTGVLSTCVKCLENVSTEFKCILAIFFLDLYFSSSRLACMINYPKYPVDLHKSEYLALCL